MNWFDKRPGHHLLILLGALIALAGTTLCLTPAYADGEKEQKQEETGKKKDKKQDKEKNKKKDKGSKDEEKSDKKKKKRKSKDKEPEESEIIPIPVGHNWEGIKVPQHDENGRLQMTFEIGSAFRADETNLNMENLKIETFDALGNPEMVIDMPKSVMDMKTRILTSADPVKIGRSDFKITGGNATFNTRTRFGTFKGPVRMLIYNRDF